MRLKKILAGVFAASVAAVTFASTANAALIVPKDKSQYYFGGTGQYIIKFYLNGSSDGSDQDAGVPLKDVAGVAFTFTVPETDHDGLEGNRDFFEGAVGGGVILSMNGGDIKKGTADWDKYNWVQKGWWGVDDPALELNTLGDGQDIQTTKVGDYTYKVEYHDFDNAIALGEANKVECMQVALGYWGSDMADIIVTQCDVLDKSGKVLATFDENGKNTFVVPGGSGAVAAADPAPAPTTTTANPDAGVEGMAGLAFVAVAAAGAMAITRKRTTK